MLHAVIYAPMAKEYAISFLLKNCRQSDEDSRLIASKILIKESTNPNFVFIGYFDSKAVDYG